MRAGCTGVRSWAVLSILAALLVLPAFAEASFVDREMAEAAALKWRLRSGPVLKQSTYVTESYAERRDGVVVYYVVKFSGGGFAIVPADDAAFPVLGYSDTGDFEYPPSSPELRSWLDHYGEEIAWVRKNPRSDLQPSREWTLPAATAPAASGEVRPMLTTHWGQGKFYNAMCPADSYGPDGHAVTGCVATAMVQIMKFWNHPARGGSSFTYRSRYGDLTADFGSTVYDWSCMPDVAKDYNDAMALANYHAGVAVAMDYAPDGSGSFLYYPEWPSDGFRALRDFFRYEPDMSAGWKEEYLDSDWKAVMRAELEAGRPIFYAGCGQYGGCHAFVADGYRDSEYFHFNWGWDGAGEGGYYRLSALTPGFGGTFSYYQEMIWNIRPARGKCDCTDGPCCDGCHFKGRCASCNESLGVEYKCGGQECSAVVMKRSKVQRCSGESAECSGAVEWAEWKETEMCGDGSVCDIGTDFGKCRKCANGCVKGSCCECRYGPCCDGCRFRPPSFACGQVEGTEYACDGDPCGGQLQKRENVKFCSGASAECEGNSDWKDWIDVRQCASAEKCIVPEGKPGTCELCMQGCSDGKCIGEGGLGCSIAELR